MKNMVSNNMCWVVFFTYVTTVYFFLSDDYFILHCLFFVILLALQKWSAIKSCKDFYLSISCNKLSALFVFMCLIFSNIFLGIERGFNLRLFTSAIALMPFGFVISFMIIRAFWKKR